MILDLAKLGGAPRKPLVVDLVASRSPQSTAVCIKDTNLSARCQDVGFVKDEDGVYYKGRMNGT